MAQEVQRIRYFTGEFLQEGDFNAEQAYHIRMRYLHNRWLHTQGIANGLDISSGPGPLQVTVSAGMAIARVLEPRILEFQGEDVAKEIVRVTATIVDLVGPANAQIYVVASFAEQPAPPFTTDNTRWLERPDIRALAAGAATPDNDTVLILARVTLNAGGSGIASIDSSERRMAGVRGSVDATQLRLPVSGIVDPTQWPTVRGGAANRLDITGTVNLTAGNLTLAAGRTVDGRDISADGADLDAHRASTAVHVTNGNNHDHSTGDGAPIPFSALTSIPDVLVKAYVVATGSAPPTVLRSFGVASGPTAVVRNSAGSYTITWASTITNPVVMISLIFSTGTFFYHITTITGTSLTFVVTDAAGTPTDTSRFMVSML